MDSALFGFLKVRVARTGRREESQVSIHVRLRGGATVLVGGTRITVSRPLAVLTIDDEGIAVTLEPIWVARISVAMASFQGAAKSDPRSPVWRVPWTELVRVLRGPRSVVLLPVRGRACRFNVRDRRRLQPLLTFLDSRHIPTDEVSSTIGWVFKIR